MCCQSNCIELRIKKKNTSWCAVIRKQSTLYEAPSRHTSLSFILISDLEIWGTYTYWYTTVWSKSIMFQFWPCGWGPKWERSKISWQGLLVRAVYWKSRTKLHSRIIYAWNVFCCQTNQRVFIKSSCKLLDIDHRQTITINTISGVGMCKIILVEKKIKDVLLTGFWHI